LAGVARRVLQQRGERVVNLAGVARRVLQQRDEREVNLAGVVARSTRGDAVVRQICWAHKHAYKLMSIVVPETMKALGSRAMVQRCLSCHDAYPQSILEHIVGCRNGKAHQEQDEDTGL
jgi:membrane-anchored protein YejM (alkaline phosphatase superfamily)